MVNKLNAVLPSQYTVKAQLNSNIPEVFLLIQENFYPLPFKAMRKYTAAFLADSVSILSIAVKPAYKAIIGVVVNIFAQFNSM